MAAIPPPPPPPRFGLPRYWPYDHPVDDDDPLWDPDMEIDIEHLNERDAKLLRNIQRRREKIYQDVEGFNAMDDVRRLSIPEIIKWAGVLNKEVSVNSRKRKKMVFYCSEEEQNRKAYKRPRVIILFRCTPTHLCCLDCYPEEHVIRVYDNSYIMNKEDTLYRAFSKQLNENWKLFFDIHFKRSETLVTFAPIHQINGGPLVGKGHCIAFSCWTALYIFLNPKTTYMNNVTIPPLPGRDAGTFYRYMRVCIKEKQLILPSSFYDYIAGGMPKNIRDTKKEEKRRFKEFLKFLRYFPKKK